MTWKVRHQGSPQAIEGLSLAQVADGLRDGLWEPTDEVLGPGDRAWAAIENHPQLEELAADIEPPPAKPHEDQTKLDMNPLIDVALVLLIFFIITATYDTIRKVLDVPGTTGQDVQGALQVTEAQVAQTMIRVEARQQAGKLALKVEDRPTRLEELEKVLKEYAGKSQRAELLIDAVGVDWGTLVGIQDAAKGAGMQRAYYLKQKQ